MKAFNTLLCLLLFVALSFHSNAQKKKSRLQPGKMYEAGETLYAPRFGFTAKVPVGWEGILPRESEVFLLSTTTSTYGEIFVFGREHGDLTSMKNTWLKGVDLSETIKITAINPTDDNGMLSSEIKAEGEYVNKGFKGFVAARCSPSGPCVTTLMIAPPQFYESVKNTVTEFMKSSIFEAPSNASPYEEFDWQDFLSDKVLVTYASAEGGSKENMIHLCKDGTFTASLKKKGFFKEQNPAYKGNLSGQWIAKGDGEKATLQFIFTNKSISPVEVPLIISDEKITSNGERYFVGNSDKCKKD
jgi:hypothetical protein